MKNGLMLIVLAAGLSACVSATNTTVPEPMKPEPIGKVSSQDGKCFFRDPAGKVFIDTCPA